MLGELGSLPSQHLIHCFYCDCGIRRKPVPNTCLFHPVSILFESDLCSIFGACLHLPTSSVVSISSYTPPPQFTTSFPSDTINPENLPTENTSGSPAFQTFGLSSPSSAGSIAYSSTANSTTQAASELSDGQVQAPTATSL